MWIWWSALALAGYGDPEMGPQSVVERSTHFWTNAARLAPEEWSQDYAEAAFPCSTADFSADELTPKLGVAWSVSLGEVARSHSDDMAATNTLSHDSSDGTAWNVRIEAAYGNPVFGENVSQGYPNGRDAVVGGWMCSTSGHRATTMNGDYTEVGIGVTGLFYTQDFGGASVEARRLNAGVIEGFDGEVYALVDWSDGSSAPSDLVAWVNGKKVPLELVAGAPEAGIYGAPVEPDASGGCLSVWFEGDGERYPEDGSLGAGGCDLDDAAAGWLSAQEGGGCSHTPSGAGVVLWMLPLLGIRRRR